MTIPRIFQDTELTVNTTIELMPDAAHHLSRVLRLQPPDALIIFNGRGGEYNAVIHAVHKQKVTVHLQNFVPIERESSLQIHLGQVISRGERMDYTIQKAVELGVHQITPLFSERCNVKLPADRLATRLAHWQKIAVSACEQCGRNYVPIIHSPITLSAWLSQAHSGVKIILDPHARSLSQHDNQRPQNISLLIGSEGGFSPEEIHLAESQTFVSLKVGPRILRTETAGVVAIAICQYRWGDVA